MNNDNKKGPAPKCELHDHKLIIIPNGDDTFTVMIIAQNGEDNIVATLKEDKLSAILGAKLEIDLRTNLNYEPGHPKSGVRYIVKVWTLTGPSHQQCESEPWEAEYFPLGKPAPMPTPAPSPKNEDPPKPAPSKMAPTEDMRASIDGLRNAEQDIEAMEIAFKNANQTPSHRMLSNLHSGLGERIKIVSSLARDYPDDPETKKLEAGARGLLQRLKDLWEILRKSKESTSETNSQSSADIKDGFKTLGGKIDSLGTSIVTLTQSVADSNKTVAVAVSQMSTAVSVLTTKLSEPKPSTPPNDPSLEKSFSIKSIMDSYRSWLTPVVGILLIIGVLAFWPSHEHSTASNSTGSKELIDQINELKATSLEDRNDSKVALENLRRELVQCPPLPGTEITTTNGNLKIGGEPKVVINGSIGNGNVIILGDQNITYASPPIIHLITNPALGERKGIQAPTSRPAPEPQPSMPTPMTVPQVQPQSSVAPVPQTSPSPTWYTPPPIEVVPYGYSSYLGSPSFDSYYYPYQYGYSYGYSPGLSFGFTFGSHEHGYGYRGYSSHSTDHIHGSYSYSYHDNRGNYHPPVGHSGDSSHGGSSYNGSSSHGGSSHSSGGHH